MVAMFQPPTKVLGAAVNDAASSASPYRGFNITDLDPKLMSDAVNQWHANMVRYDMRPEFQAKFRCHCTNQEAWDKMMQALPAELDTAKQLHLAVVLALFDLPIPHNPKNEEHDALSDYWNDPHTLQVMTQVWTQIAQMCADRDQVIWFDLKNEPLDWNAPGKRPVNWPSWAQSLINSIRQIDQRHPIVIEPGPGGQVAGFRDFPRLKGEGLIYSFHQYQPYEYSMQGIADLRDTDQSHAYLQRQLGWPGTYSSGHWDKSRLEQIMQPAIEFQRRNHVRIYVGEFGVPRWAPDAPQYLRDNIDIFEKHGWDWTFVTLRGSAIWSLEHTHDYDNPKDLQGTGQFTDRGKVLLDYFSRNQNQH